MPPKRKAKAANATAYTDPAGTAPNKRSKASKPAAANGQSPANGETGRGDTEHQDEEHPDAEKEAPHFDHSRPEERTGIVDRRFYPAEMSNERCALYNADAIPRPIELLNRALDATRAQRERVRNAEPGAAVVHWFKRDLRIRDNTGLSRAAQLAREKGVGVIGVWILSPRDWEAHLVSPAKCDFEIRTVGVLGRELAELDVPLFVECVGERGDVERRLVEVCEEWGVKNVFCNLEYEPDELRRETQLVKLCAEKGINFEPQHDDCVVPPGSLRTGGGRQYAVYTPWYRSWVAHLHAHPHLLDERPLPGRNPPGFRDRFKHLFDMPVPPAPASKGLSTEEKERFARLWPAGEGAALDRLQLFLTEKIGRYQATRNFPSANSTACVSVHHAAGTLAARTSVRMARDVNSTKKLDGGIEGIRGWISEVAWRDFYRHVLVHWPYVWYVTFPLPPYHETLILIWRASMNKPFKFEYTNIEWEYSDAHFRAWTEGKTGYPIVDAAMRCLNHTAYMHNRLRMVTASFLAKHLLLDWRCGEQYFISHLIDGDFASNNGGWGFASSTGVDPQPYFRVFNPWCTYSMLLL